MASGVPGPRTGLLPLALSFCFRPENRAALKREERTLQTPNPPADPPLKIGVLTHNFPAVTHMGLKWKVGCIWTPVCPHPDGDLDYSIIAPENSLVFLYSPPPRELQTTMRRGLGLSMQTESVLDRPSLSVQFWVLLALPRVLPV